MSDCTEFGDRLADLADDLLDPASATALWNHVGGCPACAAALERVRRRNAVLYRPFAVPEPAQDLPRRIVARAAASKPALLARSLGYAAAFAAGVLVTLVVTREGRTSTFSSSTPSADATPAFAESAPHQPLLSPLTPRRIR
jgi:anti-sigma factor RsiW